LQIYLSPVGDPVSVAGYLTDLFPNLRRVEYQGWIDAAQLIVDRTVHEGRQAIATFAHYGIVWEEVNGLIEQMHAKRGFREGQDRFTQGLKGWNKV
jgi:hypothetical protein